MNIAYLVNTYPRPPLTFIRREIRALERQGVTVHRFAMRHELSALCDPADLEEHARTEHVLDHGAWRLGLALVAAMLRAPRRGMRALGLALRMGRDAPGGRLRQLIYLTEAAWLARRCRALGVQHLHGHFGTNPATVALLLQALGGPGYSFTVHGPEEFDQPRAFHLGLKMRHARFTVAISAFGRSQLCRWANAADWPRIEVVHCGIEPQHFAAPAPLPEGGGRMVAIGRFSEQKGQLLLIEALAEARARGAATLHLILVGDGELRAQIEAAIAARGLQAHVTLTGWLDEARVRAELAAAHALVLPSFAEGLPMVVMEAMAAARPVIATWVAGVPELVQDGRTGWLVPAGDVPALAGAMVRLAETPNETLAAMGHAGRDRVLARHDVDREAAKLHALFAAFAGGGSSG